MKYETVIGLETHVELSTKSKIFCGCTTKFGAEPNSNCCPGCIGAPGTLPELNERAVEYAILAGLATNCTIEDMFQMERKHYVYPDLAKAYQNSQSERPIARNGYLTLASGKKINIRQIHLEEDAGKLVHERGNVLIDYNRSGVPLIEIVTQPDFSSATEVREYLEKLRLTMRYIDVSDCKMQEGSMRCDVNISVRPEGVKKLGTRVEIKNMNSITFITKAIEAEVNRQIETLNTGGILVQETRRYDETSGETYGMREKENATDYMYFKDPDIISVDIKELVASIRNNFNVELPDAKLKRYLNELSLPQESAETLVKYHKLTHYFEAIAKASTPKIAANLILAHIFRHLPDEEAKEDARLLVGVSELSEVAALIADGKIPTHFVKKVVDAMLTKGKPFSALFKLSDFASTNSAELDGIIDKAIAENKQAVSDYRSGKGKALFSIVGAVMKAVGGKADALELQERIAAKIKE